MAKGYYSLLKSSVFEGFQDSWLSAKCLFSNFNDSPNFYSSTEYENTKT